MGCTGVKLDLVVGGSTEAATRSASLHMCT